MSERSISLPIIGSARQVRLKDALLAILMTFSQYSISFAMSEAHKNSTFSGDKPRAVKQSLKYSPQIRMFSIFSPSLLFIQECQSAKNIMKWNPASTISFILFPQTRPMPICIILGKRRRGRLLSRTFKAPVGSGPSLGFKQIT